jgi:5-methylcytosine-specific restriction protein A
VPQRIKSPCAKSGCRNLVDAGYCEDHAQKNGRNAYYRDRGSASARGYDVAWKRFRSWFLSEPDHAICEDCRRAASTDVHHVKKVRDYPELRLVESNCRGLCHECHSKRTALGE